MVYIQCNDKKTHVIVSIHFYQVDERQASTIDEG